MEHHKLVLPEYLNDQGNLFGGYLLKWLDEFAYVTVKCEFPGLRFVTIALDNVEFKQPVACGQILRFVINRAKLGRTAVDYEVEAFLDGDHEATPTSVFSTRITFVNIDETGATAPIPRA